MVLKLRFGLVDGRTRTLEEVGQEFNITRERIPPDRSEGAEKAETSEPLKKAQRLSRVNKIGWYQYLNL